MAPPPLVLNTQAVPCLLPINREGIPVQIKGRMSFLGKKLAHLPENAEEHFKGL
jgi:hypothetical protein